MRSILPCLLLSTAATVASAATLLPDPGFEDWNSADRLPSGPKHRWTIPGQFAVCERSNQEKHSGQYSLHLKDTDTGRANQSLGYLISGREAAPISGKILYFSAWVKQVTASRPGIIGIGLYAKGEHDKITSISAGVDAAGKTDWQQINVKMTVPEKTSLIIAFFLCANGWGNTGEAYFDDVALSLSPPSAAGTPAPLPAVSAPAQFDQTSASLAYRTGYEQIPPVTTDACSRPEIRNGTWYVDGKPEFFLGPWIYNRKHTDWNPQANPLKIDHIAYTTPPSYEVWQAMGFNSAQISAAHNQPGQALYGLPVSADYAKTEAQIADYYAGFKNIPLVLDFAFGFDHALKKNNPDKYRELDQRNGHWHQFIPFCPEHPEGDRYYTSYFLGGVRAAMKNHANIMVYELFNESAYDCSCRYNARDFAGRMKRQYGTIDNANRVWKTIFSDFDEIAAITHFQQYPGLWADWSRFLGNRYAELLKKYSAVIRTADRRPNVYFTEQAAGVPPLNPTMDYRRTAEVLDVLAMEGGWRYGFSAAPKAGNEMENVVVTGGSSHWFNCDFYQGLAKGKKPVVNNEHYCTRMENGKRVPSRRSDLISSLWLELMHGSSANYTYCWDKRSFDWKTFDQAKANVINGGYKASSMLNPYNWPVSELDAFKQFEAEMAPYKDRILPFPRTKPATVALFFSYDSLRMSPFLKVSVEERMLKWYTALLHAQYPLRIVFDEEIQSGLPPEIKTLLLPLADYVNPATRNAINRFSAGGGLVIADRNALTKNEYGQPMPDADAGICRIDSDRPDTVSCIRALLTARNVKRYGTISPADTAEPLEMTDLQIIDRGDLKLICLICFGQPGSRLATVRFELDDAGEFYLYDVSSRRLLVNADRETWSAADLKKGLDLVMPPQERIILTLERHRPDTTKTISQSAIHAEFRDRQQREAPGLKEFEDRRLSLKKAFIDARTYPDVNPDRCRSLDLRSVVNMDFKDDIAGDGKGGWFDQGSNDFANMPIGRQVLAGVPFQIIDPARNNGKGALILYGTSRDYFPRAATGIKVDGPAKYLYFLHTMGWSNNGEVMDYVIHYRDGSTSRIPVRPGHEIGGWWGEPQLDNAKIALESHNLQQRCINLQCFRWQNPRPQEPIVSLDVISAGGASVPAIVAITVETP